MERFFKILYYYCLGGVVIFIAYLSIMLSVSPKRDALKRGFIPCTEEFVQSIVLCERGQLICPLGYLWQDTKCNVSVVLDGLGAWIRGKQKTPWETYLFEPVIEAAQDKDNPYEGNVIADMESLEAQREFIEARQKELEDAKNRQLGLDENVLLNKSTYTENSDEKFYMQGKDIEDIENNGDISEEFFADEVNGYDDGENVIKENAENNDLDKAIKVINKNNEEINKLKDATDKEEK